MSMDWFSWVGLAIFLVLALQAKKADKKRFVQEVSKQHCNVIQWTQAEMLQRSAERLEKIGLYSSAILVPEPILEDTHEEIESVPDTHEEEIRIPRMDYKTWVANCARVAELAKVEVDYRSYAS